MLDKLECNTCDESFLFYVVFILRIRKYNGNRKLLVPIYMNAYCDA